MDLTILNPQPSLISIVNEVFDNQPAMSIRARNILIVASNLSIRLKAKNIADTHARIIAMEQARIAKEEEKHTTVLAKAVLCAPCSDICAICLETHTKADSVTTDCGHEFGKECWKAWSRQTHGRPSCGICRKKNPTVTMYRARKPNQVATPELIQHRLNVKNRKDWRAYLIREDAEVARMEADHRRAEAMEAGNY